MAGISLLDRSQLAAIAELRWRMFFNGLRTKRGKLELASRIIITSGFAIGGLAGFSGAVVAGFYLATNGKLNFLAVPLWLIFFFWQAFPVMATAFTNNPDSSDLLRFPLTYRSFFLIRLAYGYLDPASALGTVFTIGLLLGVSAAHPLLAPWALVVLLTFIFFNLLLMQMIFAWLERWLAQRRTREILGVIFILATLSFQLIGPVMQRMGKGPHPDLNHEFQVAARVQAWLPPGVAANAITEASYVGFMAGLVCWLVLATFTAAVGWLLHLRLRAQFRGENLSEAAARPAVKQLQRPQVGWALPGFSQSVAAVFEKEIRYLSRSGPMLLTLIMPIFMLVIFRLGPMSNLRHSPGISRTPDMALPAATAYALLVLTNLVYNSFGADGGGMQFFYASPVRFSQIVMGKNLTHAAIVVANVAFAWIAVTYLYGPPHFAATVATVAGLLFAAPLNFAAGNLLSLYSPKKRDFATFGRQNAGQLTVLISFGVQIVIFGLGAGAFAIAKLAGNQWIAVFIFLILAAISIPGYVMTLQRLDAIAASRREILLAELCRA